MSNTKYFEEDLQQLAMPQLLINTLFCVLSLQTKSIIEFSFNKFIMRFVGIC